MLLKLLTLFSLLLFASTTPPICYTDVLNLLGDQCIPTCPPLSSSDGTQCQCDSGYQISQDGSSCECQTGYLDISLGYCVTTCPSRSSPSGKVCECDVPFTSDGTNCVCGGGDAVNLNGDGCISTCPARSTKVIGQCVCNYGFQKSSDGLTCVCESGYLDSGGNSCIACPADSTDIGGGVCLCDNPNMTGDDCSVCGGVVGVDGSTCMASCPDFSEPDAVRRCFCSGSLLQNGNACVCFVGDFINVDKASCVSACPDRSSENNGVCECDSPFVETGGICGCDNGDSISLDGTTCTNSCPSNSSPVNGQCKCDGSYFISGDSCLASCPADYAIDLFGTACIHPCPDHSSIDSIGQCACDAPFQPSGDGQSCACFAPDDKLTVDGLSCQDSCPENSSLIGGQCVCDDTFVASGQDCVCDNGLFLSISGDTCVIFCPQGSLAVNGQCQCQAVFTRNGNSCVCPNAGDKINVDVSSCVSGCPAYSFESGGQCFCHPSLQTNGNNCECPAGQVINLAGTGCLSGCPAYSSQSNGACECYAGFTLAGDGNSCECSNYISVDGFSCGSSCSSHSSAVGGQCVCDATFVQNGNDCQCDLDKVLTVSGDSCIDDCDRGSFDNFGQCQCCGDFFPNGNTCECPASDPIVSVDGTSCISLCPSYSSSNNGQCVCDGALVTNGNTCGCDSGDKINLAGTGCISSCPSHSSVQAGGVQCQCDAPWTLEVVNKASCVCPNSLHLSLDLLNCVTPCPAHTIVVNNACVCDSTFNFVLSSDKQSCECKSGTIYDSGSDTCLPFCSSLSPPNNVPPNCYQCDATCKTCVGPSSNECLTCYSGYHLSSSNTCNEITTKSSPSVEVAKTTKTMSSASIAASSVASVGNSGAIRVSLMGNMFQYLKFLNISYSEQLDDMLENLSSQFLPWNIDVGIPSSMTVETNYKTLPYQFTKYEQIHPSFLMNFWDDLSILVVVIGIVGVLVGLQFVVNKFYKQKTMWKFVFSKASLMAQSFLLTFTYNDLGNIIFFGLLDFKSAKKYSGVHVLNLIIAISLLLTEIGILTLHYTLLVKYRRIKRARLNPNRAKEIEEFLEKHENLKAFFEDFNDFSFIQQCFLLVAIFRDMLCNLVLVTLYEYPLAESTCFMVFSVLMIVYILYSGPFKDILNAIQQILCEGILLLVNTSVFINAVLDHIDSNDDDLRKKLGSIVVISNTVFNFVPMAFLAIALWKFSKELHVYIKGWMNKRKAVRMSKKEELSDLSNNSKVILRDLSLEGPIRNSLSMAGEENRNTTGIIQQHKLSEDLEMTSMSKDNIGIFEVKLDGDQGHDELIIENKKEEGARWSNKSGIRKVKLKRRMFPSPLHHVENGVGSVDELKLEGIGASK